ncbi:uncharacterized protein BJ171DRAFT_597796 [Polychytrium aggregatum]|uniref:uncharacterized protein n=1 Tax=Polychytrium aggregatum TaxID=110093 RepID=UPI0022FF082A|nr:uncharacterized protein BJ171DRAFT_597796 [Polychytrium aggregatum]KAI9206119.1 hypothetical protein BJ171DRAFT_597796 [Polychytrium aggregatum]
MLPMALWTVLVAGGIARSQVLAAASTPLNASLLAELMADLGIANDSYPFVCYNGTTDYGWAGLVAKLGEPDRDIVVEAGWWDSSMILNHVYEILLRDILGYGVLDQLYSGGASTGPRLQYNVTDASVELWPSDATYFEELIVYERSVVYAGSPGYIGHIGWYIPTCSSGQSLLRVVDQYPNYTMDFWRSLRDPQALSLFPASGTGPRYVNPDGTPECDNIPNGCMNGTYTPAQCVNNPYCVEFWGNDPSYSKYYNERLIDGLQLNITINYLDGNGDVQTWVDQKIQPIIFYYWTPSVLLATRNITRISFPNIYAGCIDSFLKDREHTLVTCDYPPDFLFKASSLALKNDFPYAYELLEKLMVSEADITEMLKMLDKTNYTFRDFAVVACNWINSNEDTWSKWIPSPPSLAVASCPTGTGIYRIGQEDLCLTCNAGTYNWSPNNTMPCQTCPSSATCSGGTSVVPFPNFWLDANNNPVQVVRCPLDGVCSMNQLEFNVSNQCSGGLSGVLCTECADPNKYEWNAWLGTLAFTLAIYILPKRSSASIGILTFYFQVAALINPQLSVGTLANILSIDMEISPTCLVPLRGISKVFFFYIVPVVMLLNLVVLHRLGTPIRAWAKSTFVWQRILKNNPVPTSRRANFISSMFELLMCFVLPILKVSLSILDCRRINNAVVMYTAANTICWTGVHLGAAVWAIVVLVILVGILPAFMLFRLLTLKKHGCLDQPDQERVWERCMHLPYRKTYYYWAPLQLLERSTILLYFVFCLPGSNSTSNAARLPLLLAVMGFRFYIQPYKNPVSAKLYQCVGTCWFCLVVINFYLILGTTGWSQVLLGDLAIIIYFAPLVLAVCHYILLLRNITIEPLWRWMWNGHKKRVVPITDVDDEPHPSAAPCPNGSAESQKA